MINNKEELLEQLKMGFALNRERVNELSDELKNDNEVIFELIKSNQSLVNNFSDKLIEKPELMDKVFNEISSEIYHRFSPDLKNNREFMLQLLEHDTNAAYNIGPELRKDMEFMEQAAEINEETVYFASPEIKTDLESKIKEKQQTVEMFKEKMKDMLGPEKYKLISNYPETQRIFEKINEQKRLDILSPCIKKLNEQNLDITEWTRGMERITENFSNPDYQELLSNINVENTDFNKLYEVLQKPNYYNIKSAEELAKYEEIKSNVCEAIINNDEATVENYPKIAEMNEVEQSQFAVLQKHLNLDVNGAKDIWNRYSDIEKIENQQSRGVKSYVSSIIKIMQTKSRDLLGKMYRLEPILDSEKNTLAMESEIKKLYANEFNNTLFSPENGEKLSDEDVNKYIPTEKQNDIKIVEAGTDFNMIITSIGAFRSDSTEDASYYKDWNREITSAPGVSCSYIGNDMRGTASIPEFCYGFSKMDEGALLMAGSQNLGSTTDKDKLTLQHTDRYCEYFTPENMKNYTGQYNEMLYSRVQGGERKQPDYIAVFKEKGRINNMSAVLKAVEDFKKEGIELPIVVIDTEKCKASEKEKLDRMIDEYGMSKDETLLEDIRNKIKRNSVTNYQEFSEFWGKLDKTKNNEIEPVTMEEYEAAYNNTSAVDRSEEVSKIVKLSREIQRIAENEKEER